MLPEDLPQPEPEPDDDADRVEYHAMEVGAGRPVVLVHDLYFSHEEFDAVSEVLSEDFRCVGLDLPGHGQSTPLRQASTLEEVADQLAEVLDEFAARPATLVGHGMGGTLCALVAARHAGIASGLVLVASDLGARPVEVWDGDRDFVDSYFPRLFADSFFREQPGRAASERARLEALDSASVHDLGEAAAKAGDVAGRLAGLSVPVLVVGGARDPFVPTGTLEQVGAALGAKVVVLPGCGHMVPIEAPAALAEQVARMAG